MSSRPAEDLTDDGETPYGFAQPTRLIGIGASAGGVKAMRELVHDLPADLPAAIFVVVHLPADFPSLLPEILNREGALPAAHAADREPIRAGRIYVAPPDRHLLVNGDRVRVTRGPREHGHRPAVDPLFRSLAASAGPRAVGLVLTGALDDGSVGLRSIVQAGGLALVQSDADYPDMPRNASAATRAERVPLAELAPVLARVARTPLDVGAPLKMSPDRDAIDAQELEDLDLPTSFTCPDCGGSLSQSFDEPLRFRCRVGHAYSPESLVTRQSESTEAALWIAVRTLEERADLLRRMSRRMNERSRIGLAKHFAAEADVALHDSHRIRSLLVDSVHASEPRAVDLFEADAVEEAAAQDEP